jgi:hypothetical protein
MSVKSVHSKSSVMTTARNLCSLRYIHVLISLTHSRNLTCNTLSVTSLFHMSHVHGTQKTQLEIIYKTVHRRSRLRRIRPTVNELIYSSLTTHVIFFTFCIEGFLRRQNKRYFCRLLPWKHSSTLPIYIMLSLMYTILRYDMLLGRYFHSGHCISCYSLPLNSTKKFFRFLRLE